MFVANDQEGKRITIEDAVPGGTYFCPVCGGALIVKAKESEAVKEHFAHKSRRQCDSWNYDMSEWHRTWQRFFPEECREVVVQNGEEKHRADVLINNTVIEFQHSPISAEEIAERNSFYRACGYKVVWVFDAEGKIKNEFEDTLDPCLCRETDLCWKRARREFTLEIPKDVTVYLHYRTSISNSQYAGKEFDILLLLKGVDSKQIVFYDTFITKNGQRVGYYITRDNFIKQYGASKEAVPTIYEILQGVENWRRRQQQPIRRQVYYYMPVMLAPLPTPRNYTKQKRRPYRGHYPRRHK